MNLLESDTNTIDSMFTKLADQLQGELSQNFGEYTIIARNSSVHGQIKGAIVQQHTVFLDIELACLQDIEFELADKETNPIHFFYSQQDECTIGFTENSKTYNLEEFQTAIMNNQLQETVLKLKKGTKVRICVISVCVPEGMDYKSSVVTNIHSLFSHSSIANPFIYFGSYNIKIATQIARLNEFKQEGIVKKIFIDGMVQLILAMEIEHHHNDINSNEDYHQHLSREELKTIRDLGKKIRNNVDTQYMIDMLTRESGIPAAKLQIGFKHLYGRTVNHFIKDVRLEAAEELIKTTDLTISEITYSVGFSSRSYFSKIFREKYNCSPRSFKDNLKYKAVSA